MMKNHCLARAISDMGFGEFRRQLEYKTAMRGGVVIAVDRFYASSKICFDCKHQIDELPLSVRSWTCSHCHVTHDRDVNAAKNLEGEALLAVSSTVAVCGGKGSGRGRKTTTKPIPAKQKISSESSNS